MLPELTRLAPYALLAGWLFFAFWASGHAILTKRDPRAAVSWTGLVWLVPYLGALFYLLLGINRVERRAHRLRGSTLRRPGAAGSPSVAPATSELPLEGTQLAGLVERITQQPLAEGNGVEPLENGDEAYPAMLGAIDGAKRSIWMMSYIFDDSDVARQFVGALGRARQRGVEVRVLIDDAGSIDTRIDEAFRAAGIAMERFLPARLSRRLAHFNLRNHRKLLIVDGEVAFTGGINIHRGHVLADNPRRPVRDTHFRLEGPIVAQLAEVFADDWQFTTGQSSQITTSLMSRERKGSVLARAISDGPDERRGGVRLTLLGALSCARHSVKIVTPYFLPDPAVISALVVAGLRGVLIDIVLPERSDVRIVDFATRAQLWQVQSPGIRVWMSQPPFDHSKLMVMDDYWAFIGSANWDARSFRLNFELNVECYDPALAAHLATFVDRRIARARQVTLAELDGRPLGERLRDGICRLLSPYL